MEEMTEKERKDAQMATLYELRLLFTQGDKEQYTKEEIEASNQKEEDSIDLDNISFDDL